MFFWHRARIRFSPEKDWDVNAGLDAVVTKLAGIDRGAVSMADVIVLAGYQAIAHDGGPYDEMAFCGNRVDATDAMFSENLAPREYYATTAAKVKDDMVVRGLTMEQGVALYGMTTDVFAFGTIFGILKDGTVGADNGSTTITAASDGTTYKLTAEQAVLQSDAELKAIVDKFAADEEAFETAFAQAWVYMMNAGRYTGPTTNYCDGKGDSGESGDPTDEPTQAPASGAAAATTGILVVSVPAMMAGAALLM